MASAIDRLWIGPELNWPRMARHGRKPNYNKARNCDNKIDATKELFIDSVMAHNRFSEDDDVIQNDECSASTSLENDLEIRAPTV